MYVACCLPVACRCSFLPVACCLPRCLLPGLCCLRPVLGAGGQALDGWSSQALSSALTYAKVLPVEASPFATAPDLLRTRSSRVRVARPFCILRMRCDEPSLAVVHLAFFATDALARHHVVQHVSVRHPAAVPSVPVEHIAVLQYGVSSVAAAWSALVALSSTAHAHLSPLHAGPHLLRRCCPSATRQCRCCRVCWLARWHP